MILLVDGYYNVRQTLQSCTVEMMATPDPWKVFMPSSIKTAIEPELRALGDKVLSTETFDSISDAERNLPYLRGSGRNAFGQPRSDSIVVTEGWRNLQDFGIQNGSEYQFP